MGEIVEAGMPSQSVRRYREMINDISMAVNGAENKDIPRIQTSELFPHKGKN